MKLRSLQICAAAACLTVCATAASHRNGPLLLEDQTANLNDFYLFRSYETGKSNNLVMSMSVQGFQNPDNGPSYYKFSDSVAVSLQHQQPARPGWKPGYRNRLRFQHPAPQQRHVPQLSWTDHVHR